MLIAACVLWIGLQLNAPAWFYVVLGVYTLIKAFVFGQAFGNVLNDKKEEDDG